LSCAKGVMRTVDQARTFIHRCTGFLRAAIVICSNLWYSLKMAKQLERWSVGRTVSRRLRDIFEACVSISPFANKWPLDLMTHILVAEDPPESVYSRRCSWNYANYRQYRILCRDLPSRVDDFRLWWRNEREPPLVTARTLLWERYATQKTMTFDQLFRINSTIRIWMVYPKTSHITRSWSSFSTLIDKHGHPVSTRSFSACFFLLRISP
jgi:hypothetical protein